MIKKDLSESLSFVQESIKVAHQNLPSYFPNHWHSFPEIITPCTGNLEISIGNEIYHLSQHQFALIPPRKLHSITNAENATQLIIQFSNDSLPQLHDFTANRHIIYLQKVIDNNKFCDCEITPLDILYKIRDYYSSNIFFRELYLYRELLQLFTILGEYNLKLNSQLSTEKIFQNQVYYEKFNSVAKYIDEHYSLNISLEEVASYAGFSKYHFSRIFKEYFEVSFPEYVTKQRIKHAIELLEDPKVSILDVALLSGFSSPSSFNRVFKHAMNCSPSAFRIMFNGFPIG